MVLVQLLTKHGLGASDANTLSALIQDSLPEEPLVSYRSLRKMLKSFPGLYQRLIDNVSLHNGSSGVHPLLASESVLGLIPELSAAQKHSLLETRNENELALVSTPIDNALFTSRLSPFYRITTTVVSGDNRRTKIEIIKMTNEPALLYESVATL